MPQTDHGSARKLSRRTRVIAGIAAAGLAAGVFQLLPSAGAEGIVVTQVASNADAGAVDVNRDNLADYGTYGVTNSGLSVGEQPRDGTNLRLFIPFQVSQPAIDAMEAGGTGNVSVRVRRTTNLTARSSSSTRTRTAPSPAGPITTGPRPGWSRWRRSRAASRSTSRRCSVR